ncbi:two-component system OmpR family sensor kinase [Bradyrhizobium sp. JR7.2]|uniref:histidine kinase n=1 Tax=Bradyrhizobium barranii TaxID=2992140 RepID=A0ABY3QW20_9BRAD|nr:MULTISPECIES: ATP-binding protein [Bradyrhizobium]UFW90214.1 ATP-binding protein [Bradyrhizobium japonicum]WFT98910.1 ATP-binding protein [Bradyrhizobium barranii]CUU19515.1 Sensory histidine kinase QseC CDS [Bradyrhizobium sp.]
MINSLRGRLFISLTTIVLVTGLIGGVFAHRWAFDEAIETQDSVLIQIAGLVQSGGFTGAQDLHGVDENSEVWLMELGRAPQGTPEERQLWRLQDGMRDATRQGKPVRVVLKTRSDGSRFAVAQSTGVRDEIASDMALRTVLPIAALIPCLMLVIALVIAGSLRPMVRLADELNARRADDMTALPLRDLPSELNPFVSSINGLLQRMHEMIGQQRRFIADAAHELRTPLTALSVQAENLDHVELPPAARERLAALRQGMSRSKHLLEQLLALARHDAESTDCGQWEVVELDLAAKSVIADLLREAISRGVDLGFERAESAPVRGEPVMLAAMIRNLLDNALRFTPAGGRIDVAIYRDGTKAVLRIEDNGPGVSPEEIGRIFEPFFRGQRPEGEGVGLGLSIVKRIVDRLGGSIDAANITEGERSGLRIVIKLPAAAA